MKNLPKTPQVLGRVRGIFFRVALIFSLWTTVFSTGMMTLSLGCGGAGTSAATDTATDTGTDTTDTSSDLTSTESQLYDDGPIDMPVTVAKLDSPDLTKITVTVEAITPAISPPLATTATSRITILGGARAVANTPNVTVFNIDEDESVTGAVASDGSFSLQIDGTLTATYVLAGTNTAGTEISIPLAITFDSTGNPIITVTNTSSLNTNQNLIVDSLGNYYVSTLNADGSTYTLSQRNADGTQLSVISSTLTSEPRMVATNGQGMVVILQDGTALALMAPAPLATLKLPSLSKARPAYEEWASTPLPSISDGLPVDAAPSLTQLGYGLIVEPLGRSYAVSYPAINPVTSEINPYLLVLNDTNDIANGGGAFGVALATDYSQIRIANGPNSKLYFSLASASSLATNIYRMDFISSDTGDVAAAWAARETILSGLVPNGLIMSFTVANNGDIAYTFVNEASEPSSPVLSAYWNATSGETSTIVDAPSTSNYISPIILSGSEAVVLCELTTSSESAGENGVLVYWRVGDPPNQLQDLSRFTGQYSCSTNDSGFYVSSDNLLYFYRGSDTVSPQLSVIDLNQILGL